MDKSLERIKLENEINMVFENSIKICRKMIKKEFNNDEKTALSNNDFVERMHKKIMPIWKLYWAGYKKLEDLEKEEGFPAMKFYASQLDLIAEHLPDSSKKICYYPLSGVDFYWARIFKRLICEDISFDNPKLPNMWWDSETYLKKDEIISLLKEQKIIPQDSKLEFILGNSYIEKKENRLNKPVVTLLLKGVGPVFEHVNKRFGQEPLLFGAIIVEGSFENLGGVEKKLKEEDYEKVFSSEGKDFLVPFSIGLRNVGVFVKRF